MNGFQDSSLKKLDARTRRVIASDTPPLRFSALVETKKALLEEQKQELAALGVTVVVEVGTILSVQVEVEKLSSFLALDYIVRVQASELLYPE